MHRPRRDRLPVIANSWSRDACLIWRGRGHCRVKGKVVIQTLLLGSYYENKLNANSFKDENIILRQHGTPFVTAISIEVVQ